MEQEFKNPYGYIYKIRNKLNGKIYVGHTREPLEKIFRIYRYSYNYSLIDILIKELGVENFEFIPVQPCFSEAEYKNQFNYWIKTLDTQYPKGYNKRSFNYIGRYDNHRKRKKRVLLNYYDNIVEAYTKYGKTSREIAVYYKISYKTVLNILARSGIERRPTGRRTQEFKEINP